MRLKSLTIKNWCQHRSQQIEFSPGLTALIGNNGSGKSNLLGAVYWLLTGDNPNEGKLEENFCQLAGPEEEANGRLLLEHPSGEIEIQRFLRPATAKALLRINGEKVIRGERAVTTKVMELFGVDPKMLRRFVIVAQSDIFGFLAEDPAERSKAFQKLFDTSKSEKIYAELGKAAGDISLADLSGQLQADTDLVTQWQQRVGGLVATLSTTPTVENLQQLDRDWRAQLQRVTQALSLLNGRGVCMTQYAVQSRVREQYLQTAAASSAQLKTLENSLHLGQLQADEARAALAGWQTYQQLRQAREAVVNQQTRLLQSLQRLQDPVPPTYAAEPVKPAVREVDQLDPRQLQLESHQLQVELTRHRNLLEQFVGTGLANCPVCHTPTANLEPVLASARVAVPRLEQQLSQNARLLQEIEQAAAAKAAYEAAYARWQDVTRATQGGYEQALQHVQAQRAEVQEQLRRVELQLSEMPEPQLAVGSLDAAQQVLATMAQYEQAIRDLRPVAEDQQRAVVRVDAELAALQTQLANFDQELTGLVEDYQQRVFLPELLSQQLGGDMATAQTRLTEVQQLLGTRHQLEGQLTQARASLAAAEQRLAATKQAASDLAPKRAWLERLEAYRSVFHHSGMPRFVAQENLQNLQLALNEVLGVFDTDFRVTADEGLSFTAHFMDGRQQPARRLSGGQKVVLALAFRVAVNSIFASSAGLLALDEPTAWLDEHHIRSFGPVLERLRALSTSRGLQCVFVTHERGLGPLFDKVVQL